MGTPVANSMYDNSVRDGTGDTVDGVDVDANTTTLAELLDGTSTTALNDDGGMQFTYTPYFLDLKNGRTKIFNNSGGALASGDLVYVSGYNSTQLQYEVTKAQSKTSASLYATLIVDEAIPDQSSGGAVSVRLLTGQNTNGLTVGRPVYLSSTAGGWTGTLPTAGYGVQVVGFVVVANASTGRVLLVPGNIIPWSIADQL